MLRKALIALAASVALGIGVSPVIAAMHGGGFHGGGPEWIHGGGFHGGFHDGDRGRFDGRFFRPGFRGHFHHGFRDHDHDFGDSFSFLGFASYAYPYYYAPYGSCWQPRQVLTHYGWRWREVWVCG
jgi:hypothetical protein